MLGNTLASALRHWAGWPTQADIVRSARPDDEAALAGFYARLGRQTLRRRFHCAFNRLSPERVRALSAVSTLDPHHTHTLVAVRQVRGTQTLVGHAGWQVDGPGRAEFALVVADAHQGQGIGRQLVRALLASAAQRGLDHLHASVLADNQAMLGLLRQAGMRLQGDADDPSLVQAWLSPLPAQTPTRTARVPWMGALRQAAWARLRPAPRSAS